VNAVEPLLDARGIVAGYLPGIDILQGCDLAVGDGELVGVIGPNGAGKSTLVKALFGLIPVRQGTVRLRGDDVTGLPAHELVRRGIGYVPQLRNVFPRLTVQDNLRMGVYLSQGRFAQRFDALVELFPRLAELRGARAGSLSGGERQMLAMARALMPDPSVLLLDEPSAGLAPVVVQQVFELVKRIRAGGLTVLIVEQNVQQVLRVVDRAYLLEAGSIRASGTSAEMMNNDTIKQAYLGV